MSNGSFQLKFEDNKGYPHLVTCIGETMGKAANSVFREHPEYVKATTIHGKRPFYPPPKRHAKKSEASGFTLGDLLSEPAPPHNGFKKANKDKAAVPVATFKYDTKSAIETDLRNELRALDSGKAAKEPEKPTRPAANSIHQGLTINDTVLAACGMLQSTFTVRDVSRKLRECGQEKLSEKRDSINTVIFSSIRRGAIKKEGRGVYSLVTGAGAPAPVQAKKPIEFDGKPPALAADLPVAKQPHAQAAPDVAQGIMERLNRLLITALMVSPEDKVILEEVLEAANSLQLSAQKMQEKSLKLVDVIERTLQADAIRSALLTTVRAQPNGA